VNAPTRDELLAEISALVNTPDPPPAWFREADIMAETGQGRDTVRSRLRKLVRAGELGTDKIGGARYYFLIKPSHED